MRDTDSVAAFTTNVPSTAADNRAARYRDLLSRSNVPRYKLVARDGMGVPHAGGYVNSNLFDADRTGNCLAMLGFNPRRDVWILPIGARARAIEEPARSLGSPSAEA